MTYDEREIPALTRFALFVTGHDLGAWIRTDGRGRKTIDMSNPALRLALIQPAEGEADA